MACSIEVEGNPVHIPACVVFSGDTNFEFFENKVELFCRFTLSVSSKNPHGPSRGAGLQDSFPRLHVCRDNQTIGYVRNVCALPKDLLKIYAAKPWPQLVESGRPHNQNPWRDHQTVDHIHTVDHGHLKWEFHRRCKALDSTIIHPVRGCVCWCVSEGCWKQKEPHCVPLIVNGWVRIHE